MNKGKSMPTINLRVLKSTKMLTFGTIKGSQVTLKTKWKLRLTATNRR